MTPRIVLLVLLGGGAALLIGCSAPETPKSVPLSSSSRRVLRVCAARDRLTRVDLVAMARRYNVMKGAEPSIAEILILNQKCRPTQDAEELDLTRAGCGSDNATQCSTGIVLVPM